MADQKNQNQGSQQPQTGNRNPQGQQSGQTGTSSTDYNKKREEEKRTGSNLGDRDRDRKGMRNEETGNLEDRDLNTPRAEEEDETTDEETRRDRNRQGGNQSDTRR